MNSDPYRNQAGRGWVGKAIVFSLAAALAGTVGGAILGALGEWIPLEARVAAASLLALLAIATGSLELSPRRLRLLQRDRETPQRWVHDGALRWATRNGWVLGLGATSRIGFGLWYVVPASALLVGRAELGALLYGAYSLARGAAVWPIILGPARRHEGDSVALWLLRQAGTARRLAAAQLIAVGVAVVVAVGL